jgi:hypothetical protein
MSQINAATLTREFDAPLIMTKRNRIIYWATTGFLAFGMLSQGVAQTLHTKGYVDILTHLGYPLYLLYILGIWKTLGVTAILVPRFKLLKEWAYAGFFFAMSGSLTSHLAMGDSLNNVAPSLFLLILTIVSWYFRPADRKIVSQ